MARLGVDKVVEQHRVNLTATHLDAEAVEHHNIELYVLTNLGDCGVLKERFKHCAILRLSLHGERGKGHIPRLEWLGSKRHTHYGTRYGVEACGLGVEAELRKATKIVAQLA